MRPIKLLFDTTFINTPKTEEELKRAPSFGRFEKTAEMEIKTLNDVSEYFAWYFQSEIPKILKKDFSQNSKKEVDRGGRYWCFPFKRDPSKPLTIDTFKQILEEQSYTTSESVKNTILKLILQAEIALPYGIFEVTSKIFGSLFTPVSDQEKITLQLVPMGNEKKDILLTISTPIIKLSTNPKTNTIERLHIADATMSVIITQTGKLEVKELSVTLLANQPNHQETYDAIRNIYDKEVASIKISTFVDRCLSSITSWNALALLTFVFITLSLTGIFSPFAFITSGLGIDLGLGTLGLTVLDAALVLITWKSIKTINEIPEELFVKHVSVRVPASISALPTPPVSPTQAVIEDNSPPRSTEPSPREIKVDSRDPSPSTSGTPSSSSDNDTESDEEKMTAKEKSSFPTEIKISSQPVTESNSGSEGSGHSSEDEAEHKGIIIAVPPRAYTQASNPPTPENISPRTAGEITAALGTSTASSGSIVSISTSSNESEGDSDEEKGKSSPNNASPTTNKRRATSKSNPIQLATAGDLSAATDAASFKPVLEKQPPAQTEEKAETIGSLILNNNQGSPTQSL